MGKIEKINIKNRTYYFYNDQINFNRLWCKVVKNWQKRLQRDWLLLHRLCDKYKEVSKKYEKVWEGVKKGIETINGGKKVEYGKDF